jgi:hypothetical protein
MTGRKLPAFMLSHGLSANRKIRRLSDAEFRCYVCGVLDLAGLSPVRGVLLIAPGEKATPADIAKAAEVSEQVARSTLRKLRRLETIVPVGDGTERLKNWDVWNPPPRPSETPEAWRDRKAKERRKAADAKRSAAENGRTPQLTLGQGGSSLKRTRRSGLPAHEQRLIERGEFASMWAARLRNTIPEVPEAAAFEALHALIDAGELEPSPERVWDEARRRHPEFVPDRDAA